MLQSGGERDRVSSAVVVRSTAPEADGADARLFELFNPAERLDDSLAVAEWRDDVARPKVEGMYEAIAELDARTERRLDRRKEELLLLMLVEKRVVEVRVGTLPGQRRGRVKERRERRRESRG
jgi:hypothetical protein